MSGQGGALLLIDLQESFFEEPALAEARAEVPIFLITTQHSRDRSMWTLSMLDDDQGYLFHGDPGTGVVHELDTSGMTRIEKTRDSAWFGTDLLLRIRNLQVERVVMAGVSTHACIARTARPSS